MTDRFKVNRVAILGSGVMGAQIAAVFAAVGVRVYLLDLAMEEAPKDPKVASALGSRFRAGRAILALEQLRQLQPAPFFSESHASLIIPGTFEDDLSVLAECDWVIEAVVEKLDVKKSLHKKVSEIVRPGTAVTSNTSGISLAKIVEDLPEHYASCFFGTHFFNPPRYMHLLEVIPHDRVDEDLMQKVALWSETYLGKGIVWAKDTVNFIANRIGVFAIQRGIELMEKHNLSIETVDLLTGKLFGRPSSATFRTVDVVGLDTFAHVAKNTFDLAPDDPYRDSFKVQPWVAGLIEKGAIGQKSKDGAGFYKKTKDDQGKTKILVFDRAAKSYRDQNPDQVAWLDELSKVSNLGKRLEAIFAKNDVHALYLWELTADIWSYVACLFDSIAGRDDLAVDQAMCWGFNWEMGPFEMWRACNAERCLARMRSENRKLPSDWSLTDIAPQKTRVRHRHLEEMELPRALDKAFRGFIAGNEEASLIDVGDGIACLSFHSKMNALSKNIIGFMQEVILKHHRQFDGLMIANQGQHFSAGANLKEVSQLIKAQSWAGIDSFVREFQGTLQLLKFATFPSIACPFGLTLGGGLEVVLHTTEQLLHAETYAGLVEAGVGLLPAGGGTKELTLRAYNLALQGERADPLPFLQRAFLNIGMAKTSTSGHHAIELGLVDNRAHVLLSKKFMLLRAKAGLKARLEEGHGAKVPVTQLKIIGDPGVQTFRMMLYNMREQKMISAHDELIATKVATVLCGGSVDPSYAVSEQYLLDLERQGFVELCQTEKTLARTEAMLTTGSPLRN